MPIRILGVDFTSAPRPRKPITCAWGSVSVQQKLVLEDIVECTSFDAFSSVLATEGPWVGAFDLPFGLPSAFVAEQGWPRQWSGYTTASFQLSRRQLVDRCRAYANARPPGQKLAYRETDRPARSSSAMWWMNPPVVLMYHAGVPLLQKAGVCIEPCRRRVRDSRVALEGYPGLIQKRLGIGSYKQDVVSKQTQQQRDNRAALLKSLDTCSRRVYGCSLIRTRGQSTRLLDDGSGDSLDAYLCLVQACYGALRQSQGYGLPANAPIHEGWIVTA